MPKIFISYRREDSKHAVGRLHAALSRHVANPRRDIFIDIDNIPKGVDFVDHLDGKVAECDVMLAVIGPQWISIADPKTQRRRLDDPGDFVRIEVASALKRGIPVVPVVLDETPLPTADVLPDDLKPLARRNGERLEHESFAADVARLIKGLPVRPGASKSAASSRANRGGGAATWVTLAVLALVAGGGAAAWFLDPGDWRAMIRPAMSASTDSGVSPQTPAQAPLAVAEKSAAPTPAVSAPAVPAPTVPAPADASLAKAVSKTNDQNPSPVSETLKPVKPTPKPAEKIYPLRLVLERTLPGAIFSLGGYSPDGSRLITRGDKVAQIWDTSTGAPVGVLAGHSNYVVSAAYSRDGARIATTSADGTARIWDAATRAPLAVMSGHAASVNVVSFSPDGSRIVTGSWDKTARIWDVRTGNPLATLVGATEVVFGAAFSPDGSRVVTASTEFHDNIRLWDARTGALLSVLSGHTNGAYTAMYSRDGSRILTASNDGTARIWDAATGATLVTLNTHSYRMNSAAFSPDGSRVATASDDGNVRLWDATTGAIIGLLFEKNARFKSAIFSPDGAHIAISADNTRIYRIDAS